MRLALRTGALHMYQMFRDSRFEVNYAPIRDLRPWEVARNASISAARQINADWLLSFDNDNYVPGCNPLDIIAQANPARHHVIGLTYGVGSPHGAYAFFPEPRPGMNDGPFRETAEVGGGVLVVHKTVWQKIKGPWFRWQHAENETLQLDSNTCGEDVYFCNLVRQHGLRVWTHAQLAGHYRTTDLTGMVSTLAQLNQRAQRAPQAPQPSRWVTAPR